MSLLFLTPQETAELVAQQARGKRLALNLSQKSLSSRSGVSCSVIKKFEKTYQISLGSLLKIALVLNELEKFKELFQPPSPEKLPSLDVLIQQKTRKRGRK